MTMIRRRPNNQPSIYPGYDATPKQIASTQKFNKDLRYVQGFRQAIPVGDTLLKIQLDAPGLTLLGFTVTPVTGTDLTDVQVTLTVNGNNLTPGLSAQSANPLAVQGMLFFPVPQPLAGNDTITAKFQNNSIAAGNLYMNVFYVPRN